MTPFLFIALGLVCLFSGTRRRFRFHYLNSYRIQGILSVSRIFFFLFKLFRNESNFLFFRFLSRFKSVCLIFFFKLRLGLGQFRNRMEQIGNFLSKSILVLGFPEMNSFSLSFCSIFFFVLFYQRNKTKHQINPYRLNFIFFSWVFFFVE